jgi:hypothetical protein
VSELRDEIEDLLDVREVSTLSASVDGAVDGRLEDVVDPPPRPEVPGKLAVALKEDHFSTMLSGSGAMAILRASHKL